jgi:cell division protein FtsA
MKELFGLLKGKLDALFGGVPLSGGVVLTGGGANLLGAADLAALIFNMPVRIGIPLGSGPLIDDYKDPQYATAIGLALEGEMRTREEILPGAGHEAGGENILKKFAGWIKGEFF